MVNTSFVFGESDLEILVIDAISAEIYSTITDSHGLVIGGLQIQGYVIIIE